MLFNSYVFIFAYLPVTLAGFFVLARYSHRSAALWLAAASLFFYGWWNPVFVILVLASITINYAFGYAIGRSRLKSVKQAKVILTAAVLANLGLLAYFKYANFFLSSVSQVIGIDWITLDIVLPLGISFFTFTQIAFLVDVHRGIAREYSFIHYLLFVTYFPHLIAGPVLHHKQMMPQFGHVATYRFNADNFNIGLTIFVIGLAKKVLLADQFALYSNPVFDAVGHGGEPRLFEAWVGALAYTLQLYFDFSGYSDMAIGLSRMFNVKLPLNFDSPYKALNVIEFWRRWHMTLSAFLRDYLYVPLGGNRKGGLRRYVNLMITMLLGGLWHGAGWTFVLWGGLHGVYLVINHGWRGLTGAKSPSTGWRAIASIALTFTAVMVAWVPFRASDMDAALRLWAGMFGANGLSLPASLAPAVIAWVGQAADFTGLTPMTALPAVEAVLALSLGLVIVWLLPNTQQWMSLLEDANYATQAASPWRWAPRRAYAFVVGAAFGLSLLSLHRVSEFLYFQF